MSKEITPKAKAKELVEKFRQHSFDFGRITEHAKQCALILCDEILSLHMISAMGRTMELSEGEFWEKVKEEIKKL